MAHPHQSYPHAGQAYYQHPPPGYPYQHGAGYYPPYPMSPMNAPAMPPHQPASPRMNGSARGGYHPHRAGGQPYPQYPQYPPPYLHQPMPAPISPMTPPSPYTHPQKYPPHPQQHMPYTHPYQHPPNGYNGAWSTPAQTLSPLPKQLSMPVQLPPPQSQPHEASAPIPVPIPESAPVEQPSAPSEPTPSEATLAEATSEVRSTPPPIEEKPATPPPDPAPEIEGEPSPPDSPASTSSRLSQGPTAPSSFVIWSRKPRDPSRAQGVMISARAHPPQNMVQEAMNIRTPPQSPKLVTVKLSQQDEDAQPNAISENLLESLEPASSSATETTSSLTAPETPVGGSPSTTHTSVIASSPVAKSKVLESPEAGSAPTGPSVAAEPTAIVTTQASVESPSQASVSAPQAPPVKPAPAGPKKSWASLLQPTDATASSSKSRLPTSAVVGFSIPAGLQNGVPSQASSSSAPVAPALPEVYNLLTSGPSGAAHPPKTRPRGLVNTGNMCFANAVLQILVYCQPFNRLFTELGKFIHGPVVGSQQEGTLATPLVDATIQFLKEFAAKEVDDTKGSRSKGKEREEDFDDLDSFIPTYIYEAMKEKKRFANMVGGHQEDAEEFLGFFLDTLEEELLSITSSLTPKTAKTEDATPSSGDSEWLEVGKKNRTATTRSTKTADSPITRIFGGKFRSTLKAPHQRDSITEEDWRSLRLDIQREQVHNIKDALQFISHPHSVEITAPTRPGVVIEASRQELIESLPPVLVLHLKRFLYDTNVGDVVKIGKQVSFSPELEFGPDLISPARKTAQPVKYQLFGAVYHHGQSASGGHYTLDVLHPNRDLSDKPRPAWIRIDDELVSDIRPEDIFGAQERDDRCAYLLFYRRISPALSTKSWSQTAR